MQDPVRGPNAPRPSLAATLVGAARLDLDTYRAVALDPGRWVLAVAVVALGSLSHAGLGVAWATAGGWPVSHSVIPAALSDVALWVGTSGAVFLIGRLGPARPGVGAVARAIGLGGLPAILYALGVLPPILLAMGAWWFAATWAAVRAALGLGPFVAAGVAAIGMAAGWLLAATVTVTVLEWLP